MRSLSAFVLLGLVAAAIPSHADQKVLDCNIGFGDIAQVTIYRGTTGYSIALLTNTGRMLAPQPLDPAQWNTRDIRFEYRGERYRFHSTNGRSWQYEGYPGSATSPDLVGNADCS